MALAVLDAWLSRTLEKARVPEHVTLDPRLNASDAEVNIDRERFRRAIYNVINNAVDAVAETAADSDAEILISSRTTDSCAYIEIADSGPGIPEAIMSKILDPLFSTKSFGFGLGLPFVVRVLEEHEGGVNVRNRKAGGTLVELWLPVR